MVMSVTLANAATASTAAVPATPATASQAPRLQNQPLDFSYRVSDNAVSIGIVFDDGRDIFVQPADPALVARLRVTDAPFVLQGPYLVVRGLANRVSLAVDGARARPVIIDYTGGQREETVARDCTVRTRLVEERFVVPFGTGALSTEPGAVDQLAHILASARAADRVRLIALADRAQSPLAQRRTARVREVLIAGGVAADTIETAVRPPAASSLEVVTVRQAEEGCERTQPAAAAAAAAARSRATASHAAANPAGGESATPTATATATATAVALASGSDSGATAGRSTPAAETALTPHGRRTDDAAGIDAAIRSGFEQAVAANRELARPVSDSDRRRAVQQIMALAAQGRISEQIAATLMVAAVRGPPVAPELAATAPATIAAAAGVANTIPPAPAAIGGDAAADAVHDTAPAGTSARDPLRLAFLPNTSVQATLRAFLRGHGFDVEFRSMPLLMIEDAAEVSGGDLRELLRRALARLGLRGEIQGNRLPVVELAN
jgi:hypothetical protein